MTPTTSDLAASGAERRNPPSRLGGMLLAVGPGIVVTGSVIGSGELINTPVQAAKFGFVLLWAVIISCIIKYFLQVEIGRHALVHNRTPFDALNALPGPKIGGTSVIGTVFVIGSVLTAAAIVGILGAIGGLMHTMLPLTDNTSVSSGIWCTIIAVFSWWLLWQGSYRRIEGLITVLVGLFSVSVVLGLVLLQNTPHAIDFDQVLSGLTFSLGDIEGADFAVISLLGALGATGNELFMYPYWILEKGYGQDVGTADEEGWLDRAKGWIKVLQLDVFVCTTLATVTTLGYFLIAAAVFFGSETKIGDGMNVVEQLSGMYTQTYGPWSKWIFLIGAFCTLFSTLIVATAAFSRTWCDMFVSYGVLKKGDDAGWQKCLRLFQTLYLAGFLITVLSLGKPPADLVIFGQYIAGLFGTPLLMVAICMMAFRTDERVRMGKISAAFLLISVVVIALCVVVPTVLKLFSSGE